MEEQNKAGGRRGEFREEFLARLKKLLNWRIGVAVLAVALVYALIGCPIKYFTGISCPGCGMSRAAWSLVRLDFAGALYHHPLVFLLPLVPVVYFVRMGPLAKPRVRQGLLVATIVLFIAVYLCRMIWGGHTVVNVEMPPFWGDIKKLFLAGSECLW